MPATLQSPQNQTAVVSRDYHDVIAKVAAVKDLDVDKLAKLLALQEEWERRTAATHYNEQMALAQSQMTTISKDSVNKQTSSRYASLAALDDAIRPIYTRCGFSVEFNDETPADRPDWLRLVCYVSCGAETRRREKWIPVVTAGIAGRQMMTATHASIAAVTYGRRALLKMIFNLAEDDDDGDLAGGRVRSGPEQTPEPETIDVDGTIAAMNACETLAALKKIGDGLLKRDLFPVDKAELVLAYNDRKAQLEKAPAEKAAKADASK
jgi:hypothetical protein